MKKLLTIVALCSFLFLASCNNNESQTESNIKKSVDDVKNVAENVGKDIKDGAVEAGEKVKKAEKKALKKQKKLEKNKKNY